VTRAMWKAEIAVGGERVGVRLYSAVEDRSIRFHLLHEKDLARVRQRMMHPRTGETVDIAQARRGVEVERGVYVLLGADELERLEPEPSREIFVSHFVASDALDHRWFDRPYWLGPDDGQTDAYFALALALEREGREGIARWTMRKRDYVGALRAERGYLALVTLHAAGAVLPLSELPAPAGRKIDERERKLAAQLVEALAGDFEPEAFHEDYRERVLELVAAKRKGKKIKLQRFRPAPVREESLADALARSVEQAA
jgi:DNA end-binding protein Ku